MASDPGGPIIGVDEAGRGPVLGPMCVAGVAATAEHHLPDGIDDSKALDATTRSALAEQLYRDDRIKIVWSAIPPAAIDAPGSSLTDLTVGAMAAIIDGLDPTDHRCIVDAAGTDPDRFGRDIETRCRQDVRVIARHRADEDYPIVGAASIVAKVARDAAIEAIAADHGAVGSGYPSDPATRSFLATFVADNERLPPFARSSWQTCQDLLARQGQQSLEEF